jgi:hypothetical protein
VLDTTDAAAVLELERSLDLARTLFLVSTKSGTTIETLSLYRHFRERVDAVVGEGPDAGRRFCAITDPGGPLEDLAAEEGFARTFLADPEIGGRYSALSPFGLVPAALMGADVRALLEGGRAGADAAAAAAAEPGEAVWLGCALAALALAGRDKLTLVIDEPLGAFALWAEQLVAESLGKRERGIVPVAGEPLAEPDAYADDRVFLHLARAGAPDPVAAERLDALAAAGHPVIGVEAGGPEDLGRLFFGAELATAIAGWALAVNPFDQPDVQEAKDRTQAVLERNRGGAGPAPEVVEEDLRELLGALRPPRYLAVLAYTRPSRRLARGVDRLRGRVREATGVATTFAYGPRYLHSTGQLHKGGPPTGAFLCLRHDGAEDVEVPGAGYSLTALKNAQADGDLEALRARGRPAADIRLEEDPVAGVDALAERVDELLARCVR